MHDAQLHLRARKHRFDGFRKSLESVHASDEDILLEFTEAQIIKTEGEILRRVAKAPAAGSDQKLQNAVDLWKTIPGVDETTACVLAAEIGTRMEQFPSAAHLASWAGLCPGNNESAGKRRSGKTRKGSVWLRRALCQAAWATSHTKNTYLSALYRRLIARKGKKKTIVAVAHTILVTACVSNDSTMFSPSRRAEQGPDCWARSGRPAD